MKSLITVVIIALAFSMVHASPRSHTQFQGSPYGPPEHGGGCRKSSPPGQCCHMDNKAGSVHCH